MKSKITLSIVLLLCMCHLSNAQGKLNRAKEDLSTKSSTSSSSSSSSSNNNDNDDDDDSIDFLGNVFGEIIYRMTIGILFGAMEERYFYKYPYSDGSHGEYAFPDENVPLKQVQLMVSNTFFTSGKEFYGNNLKLNLRFVLLGIEANHLHFFEKNPEVELGVSSVMINYYRVRGQNVTAYWGAGATHVGNGVDETGFAYQVGVDVYLNKPFSIGTSWKQSFINSASINEFRLLARYHLKRFSLQGGFNHYKLGSVSVNALSAGIDYRF
ncbi:hypothetical protein [Kordia sp.]|uniref:hypothetical protein n=1 Tax=Kordia sp. TaxID=1965332 RepID=UPI003B5C6AA1